MRWGKPIVYEGRIIHHDCQKCGKAIKPGNETFIEWDTRTGPSSKPVEEAHSQGWFAYGPECGPKLLKKLKSANQ